MTSDDPATGPGATDAAAEAVVRIAVITGGGGGLGNAMARVFARANARPPHLDATGAEADDLDAMLAHRPMIDGDVVMPDHAIRNLLQDLVDDEPYSITHGSFRPAYQARSAAMDAAFDRMETS